MIERLRRLEIVFDQPEWRLLGRIVRFLFFAGMIAWLALKVNAIGWQNVLAALPTQPMFYILFFCMFLALPLSELLIFGILMNGAKRKPGLPIFIRKRIFNSAVVGYSGDIYLLVWMRRYSGLATKKIVKLLKDNAVLSALASAVITAALLAAFTIFGKTHWLDNWFSSSRGPVIAAVLGAAFLIPILIRLRRHILSSPPGIVGSVFGIHIARISLVVLLQATQWAVVLTAEPWTSWLLFLTMQMVISRLPVVPNRDLLFLSAGLELSNAIEGPRASMAGLLLAGGALTQATNLTLFLLTSWLVRRARRRGEVPEDVEAFDPMLPDEEIAEAKARLAE